jgi:hypothetical protein
MRMGGNRLGRQITEKTHDYGMKEWAVVTHIGVRKIQLSPELFGVLILHSRPQLGVRKVLGHDGSTRSS